MNRPALEVADVVRQYGAAYLARYGSTLSPEQHRALRAIAVCRTAALGGHATQCEQCGHVEITYNSWGNRHSYYSEFGAECGNEVKVSNT